MDAAGLVRVDRQLESFVDEVFSTLMGDDVAERKHFIQQNADDVRFLDI